MAYTKEIDFDAIEIIGPYRQVRIRMKQRIYQNGEFAGEMSWNLKNKMPDEDITDFPADSGLAQKHKTILQNITKEVWTQDIKDQWTAKKEAEKTKQQEQL